MNIYHKAMFCWNFQRDVDSCKIDSHQDNRSCVPGSMLPSLTDNQTKDPANILPPQPQQTMRYKEFELDTKISRLVSSICPGNIYLFKVINRNTRKRCEICSKSTIKTPEWRQWRRYSVFIVNFEHISPPFSSFSIVDFEQVNISWVVP